MKPSTTSTLLLMAFMSACSSQKNTTRELVNDNNTPIREHSVLAVLWQQQSAEYRALCYQAYNAAKTALDEVIQHSKFEKPLAIITDIDETVLDNTPYAAMLIKQNINYEDKTWREWVERESAPLVPGALAFLTYAKSQQVDVFYVSNRLERNKSATMGNLKKHGLPDVLANHVWLKTTAAEKETRRESIAQTHEVVMLIGDNLSDLHKNFDQMATASRHEFTDDSKALFGTHFIVLPNPVYGDWETEGIYEGQWNLSEPQKAAMRNRKLKL